jgi:hypothetical protein
MIEEPLRSRIKQAIGRTVPRWRDLRRSRRAYRAAFGHSPRFLFAKTFNEKMHRYKVLDRDSRMPLYADKFLVKKFVTEKLGLGWTTPTIWHGASLPPLHERIWPLPFVLKSNHGSGMNIFVRSANDLNWPRIEALCANWLSTDYGEGSAEWQYYNIERQLLVEPFIGRAGSLPIDYKCWTFHGHVEFIQVDTDREHEHKQTMFDREWKRLPFNLGWGREERQIDPPPSLEHMIAAAQKLSEGISFVCVDFYEIDGAPRFGEMTFHPMAGLARFDPPEYDAIIGALWR